MSDKFSDLGLGAELARAAEELGFSKPTALQRASIPVLRRGGNAILRASTGAGVSGAYGLSLLDRLLNTEPTADAPLPRAVIVAATPEEASHTAEAVGALGAQVGVSVRASTVGWSSRRLADVEVVGAEQLLDRLRDSSLKLEGVQTFVIDGLATMLSMGAREAIETALAAIPRESQRVIVTAEFTREIDALVEQHVRRALTIPPRPAEAETAGQAPTTSTVAYAVTAESDKISAVASLLSDATERPVLVCRTDTRAAEIAHALTVRGFVIGSSDDPDADLAIAADDDLTGNWILSFDVPFDADTLRRRHLNGGIVLVTARELAHLRRIAQEANFGLRPMQLAQPSGNSDLVEFRERIRAAVREEDISAQILLLDPLLEELSALEIAAAVTALLRKRVPARRAEAPTQSVRSFVRLFIALGERDSIRPADLVGAITGEAGVPGDQIGRIEIRDTFSVVEVPSDAADKIIRALNGTTVKGRSVRVDYDRRGSNAAPRQSRDRRQPPNRGSPDRRRAG